MTVEERAEHVMCLLSDLVTDWTSGKLTYEAFCAAHNTIVGLAEVTPADIDWATASATAINSTRPA